MSPLTLSLPIVPLIDFTLSNARRFYSSVGNPTGLKGLKMVVMTMRLSEGVLVIKDGHDDHAPPRGHFGH